MLIAIADLLTRLALPLATCAGTSHKSDRTARVGMVKHSPHFPAHSGSGVVSRKRLAPVAGAPMISRDVVAVGTGGRGSANCQATKK